MAPDWSQPQADSLGGVEVRCSRRGRPGCEVRARGPQVALSQRAGTAMPAAATTGVSFDGLKQAEKEREGS
jgi:hypothetical protein